MTVRLHSDSRITITGHGVVGHWSKTDRGDFEAEPLVTICRSIIDTLTDHTLEGLRGQIQNYWTPRFPDHSPSNSPAP